MRYAVVIEKAGNNYSAYVPDLPGCVADGSNGRRDGGGDPRRHPLPYRRTARGPGPARFRRQLVWRVRRGVAPLASGLARLSLSDIWKESACPLASSRVPSWRLRYPQRAPALRSLTNYPSSANGIVAWRPSASPRTPTTKAARTCRSRRFRKAATAATPAVCRRLHDHAFRLADGAMGWFSSSGESLDCKRPE